MLVSFVLGVTKEEVICQRGYGKDYFTFMSKEFKLWDLDNL